MKGLQVVLLPVFCLLSCSDTQTQRTKGEQEVERIIRILSADDMQGRATPSLGLEKASKFIDEEFRAIGLKAFLDNDNFLQQFPIRHIKPEELCVTINGKKLAAISVMVITDLQKVSANQKSPVRVMSIERGQHLIKRYQEILKSDSLVLVLVDESHTKAFKDLRNKSLSARTIEPGKAKSGVAVFVLGLRKVHTFAIDFKNQIEDSLLSNVVGIIPGKSKAKESVIFSAHYDHLGIIKPGSLKAYFKAWRFKILGIDSIANGADDNASGVTAMIALARYFKNLNNNERTLIFAAFTAEEIGGYGSRHFIEEIDPSDVVAVFNIEMIGKQSKFGENSAFITGYDKTDFGKILQANLIHSDFKFYPDPYPELNLFYRSDNANFAALGIPAHTISTDQIDVDRYYHTVKDEYVTLNITHIANIIKAIELSSRSIVSGKDTPKRIPALRSPLAAR
ncbi:M20/M25/M40 family metallo-hydrolase [Flavihumibacter sp. R14]|nr:M20/M25/M40 family metallo-hydrolase [Flavihumibacter soli]